MESNYFKLIMQCIGIFLGTLIISYIINKNITYSMIVALAINIPFILIFIFTGRLMIKGWKK